jgi:hypothetical protein
MTDQEEETMIVRQQEPYDFYAHQHHITTQLQPFPPDDPNEDEIHQSKFDQPVLQSTTQLVVKDEKHESAQSFLICMVVGFVLLGVCPCISCIPFWIHKRRYETSSNDVARHYAQMSRIFCLVFTAVALFLVLIVIIPFGLTAIILSLVYGVSK